MLMWQAVSCLNPIVCKSEHNEKCVTVGFLQNPTGKGLKKDLPSNLNQSAGETKMPDSHTWDFSIVHVIQPEGDFFTSLGFTLNQGHCEA